MRKEKNNKMNKVKVTLLLIVLFGLLLRIIFFVGVTSGDDIAYNNLAYQVSENTFDITENFKGTRIGLIYPTALFYKLFGVNLFTANLLPLIISLLSIILIYSLGKLLFNERVGLIGAFLLSIFPLHITYSTIVFPDLPSAFFVTLAVYLFLKAEKEKSYLYFLSSGISIGIAYLMKELSIIIFVFFPLYLIYKKTLRKEHLLVPFGFLIIFSLESLYYFLKTSDALFRYNIVKSQNIHILTTYYPSYLSRIWERLFLHYPYVVLTQVGKFFYTAIFLSALYLIMKKRKKITLLLLWTIPIFLYFNFGSVGFSQYIPLTVNSRYLDIITIPSILILAYFLNQKEYLIKKYIMPIVIVTLVMTSLYLVDFNEQKAFTDTLRDSKSYLQSIPEKTIYIDSNSEKILTILFNYERDIIPYNEYNIFENKTELLNMDDISDSYIIVNKKMIKASREVYEHIEYPEKISDIPLEWNEIKSFGTGDEKLTIYAIN